MDKIELEYNEKLRINCMNENYGKVQLLLHDLKTLRKKYSKKSGNKRGQNNIKKS